MINFLFCIALVLFSLIAIGYYPASVYAKNDVVKATDSGTAIKIEGSKNTINMAPELKKPTFTEKTESCTFSLSENGFTCFCKISDLNNKKPITPFYINGFYPITLYIENGKPYIDTQIYSLRGMPPIEIKHNEISNMPPNWDLNSNERALEIVDENNNPVFQYIYKTSSHIIFKGIIVGPRGELVLADKKLTICYVKPDNFKLIKIFKHPAWRYPGQFEEETR